MTHSEERIYSILSLAAIGFGLVLAYRPPDAPDDFHFKRTRAQYTAVLRAMHSLARKYPESIKLSGGQGREPLWLEYTAETDFEKLLGRR